MILETTTIVDHSINVLINHSAEILYDHYITSKEPAYNSNTILHWDLMLMEQQFITNDPGESKYALFNKWVDEDEPRYRTIDNFTSKAVKVRTIHQQQPEDAKLHSLASSSRLSNSKFQRSVSKVKLFSKLGASTPAPPPVVLEESVIYQPPIERVGDITRPPTPDPIIDRLREQREIQEKDYHREQERMRKINQEHQEYEERKKEQQKQLKNKQYTFDYDGQIVFITNKPAELSINEVMSVDVKTNQPLKIVREITQIPISKPVKEHFTKGEEDNKRMELAQAIEYPKQPPIIEAMKPKVGTNIIFDNGYVKEGGEFKINNKISKKEYEIMLSGQIQKKQKPSYEYQEDEIMEKEDSLQKKLHQNVQNEQRNIKIANEEYYLRMMDDDSLRKSNSSMLSKKMANSQQEAILPQENVSPLTKSNIKLERINAYKKFEDFKGQEQPKVSKMHKAVVQFDRKLLENPLWGFADQSKEVAQMGVTSYRTKHVKSDLQLPNIKRNDK